MSKITVAGELTDDALSGVAGGGGVQTANTAAAMQRPSMPSNPMQLPQTPSHAQLPPLPKR